MGYNLKTPVFFVNIAPTKRPFMIRVITYLLSLTNWDEPSSMINLKLGIALASSIFGEIGSCLWT